MLLIGTATCIYAEEFMLHMYVVCISFRFFPANACVGAAIGSFIGGVLLTVAIGGGVAGVIFFMAKRKFTTKLE